MSTSVGYSMTTPCSRCGESGPTRWVEIEHSGKIVDDPEGGRMELIVVGACLQCRGVSGTSMGGAKQEDPSRRTPETIQHAVCCTDEINARWADLEKRPNAYEEALVSGKAVVDEFLATSPRKRTCRVHPGRCVRADWHHGEHEDRDGNRWNYGHCAINPLVTDCPACRTDSHAFDSRPSRDPTSQPPRTKAAPVQLSLF